MSTPCAKEALMQTENRLFDDLARVASGAINTLGGLREEIELRVKERLERFAGDMDLVSREEFDAVKAMATKARAEQKRSPPGWPSWNAPSRRRLDRVGGAENGRGTAQEAVGKKAGTGCRRRVRAVQRHPRAEPARPIDLASARRFWHAQGERLRQQYPLSRSPEAREPPCNGSALL
jgi:BMFP domain-containing protein YqiC